jgi:hypothetical protein
VWEVRHNFTKQVFNVTFVLESQIGDSGHDNVNWIELAEDNG